MHDFMTYVRVTNVTLNRYIYLFKTDIKCQVNIMIPTTLILNKLIKYELFLYGYGFLYFLLLSFCC